jgi:copper chaperone CopZ
MNDCSYERTNKIITTKKEITTMKKSYKIEVDCANCANKMEEAAKNTAGVKDATVNFMMLKMNVEFEEGQNPKEVMKEVLKNCKKVEDDCEIYL